MEQMKILNNLSGMTSVQIQYTKMFYESIYHEDLTVSCGQMSNRFLSMCSQMMTTSQENLALQRIRMLVQMGN